MCCSNGDSNWRSALYIAVPRSGASPTVCCNCFRQVSQREAISRARYCAWLLEEGGLPVRTIATSRQREVIWRDAHQIVTKPSADLPRAFA